VGSAPADSKYKAGTLLLVSSHSYSTLSVTGLVYSGPSINSINSIAAIVVLSSLSALTRASFTNLPISRSAKILSLNSGMSKFSGASALSQFCHS
jgi:hypothetical protein